MTDADELRRLSVGYAAAVDGLDGRAFAALFTSDGELWVPDLSHGREPTICRSGSAALERIPNGLARFHATHHGVSATSFTVDGDDGTGLVSCVAHHLTASAPDGSGTDAIWYIHYDDVYRRDSGTWRIARRTLRLLDVEERTVAHVGPGR